MSFPKSYRVPVPPIVAQSFGQETLFSLFDGSHLPLLLQESGPTMIVVLLSADSDPYLQIIV